MKWYRKAAEQGLANAQYNLGIMYANGRGVAKDECTAVKWYRKAAEQGDADAQYNLGVTYHQGQGVPRNLSEALRLFRKAEAAGKPEAVAAIPIVLRELQRQKQQQQAGAAEPSESITLQSSPSLPIGARVELHGLQGKSELNGRRGVVVKFIGSSGRYRVQLEGDMVDGERGGEGEAFSLSAENLNLLDC